MPTPRTPGGNRNDPYATPNPLAPVLTGSGGNDGGSGFPEYGGTTYSPTSTTKPPLAPVLLDPNQGAQQAKPPKDNALFGGPNNLVQNILASRTALQQNNPILFDYLNMSPDDDKQREVWETGTPTVQLLTSFGKSYGLESDPAFQDLANQYIATQQIYQQAGDKKGAEEYSAQFIQQVPQVLTQLATQKRAQDEVVQQQRIAQQQAEQRFDRILQLQSQFAPIFQSIAQQTGASNQMMYEQALNSADQLASADPRLAEAIKVNATATRSSNDALLAAYANQIAMTPTYVADMLYRETYNANAMQQPLSDQSTYQGLIGAYQAATQQQ